MDRRTSKLAATALALGLLGFSACAGLAAIILGVVSLHRVGKSGGRLGGRGMAVAGIVCALLIPAFLTYCESHRSFATRMVCGSNLARVGKAIEGYATDHDGRLPTPSKWCDVLLGSTDVKPDMLQCRPFRRLVKLRKFPLERYLYIRWKHAQYLKGGACDYAMNRYVEQCGTSGPPDMVLLFEARPGWNQVGGLEALTTEHHEGDGCNIMFLDTHVEFVKTEALARLRWKP